MNKVLKKYRKWIMVGGGVFIMVAWLLPNGLSGLQDPNRQVRATVAGRTVKGLEWGQYNKRFEAIKMLTTQLAEASAIASQIGAPSPSRVITLKQFGCDSMEHFLLLAKEAEREGMIGGAADAQRLLDDSRDALAAAAAYSDLQRGGEASTRAINYLMSFRPDPNAKPEDAAARDKAREDYLAFAVSSAIPSLKMAVMGRLQMNEPEFEQAAATYAGIRRMFENYLSIGRFSDRRVVNTARRFGEAVEADFVLVPSDRLIARIPEPTAEEVSAHYEKFKNVEPGTGPNGIGYRKPPRVKIEWLTLDKSKIAESIKLQDAHVREKWNEKNPGGTGEQFAKDKASLELELRKAYAEDIIRLADLKFREIASEAARAYPAQGKFRELPADWRAKALPLDVLAAQIVAGIKLETAQPDERERWQSPVEIPMPAVSAETGWRSAAELEKLPGIGAASLVRGNEKLAFSEAALEIRELLPETRLFTQVGIIPVFDRPLADLLGNHFYFRATAARPAGEPESLDEVRDQVVKDIKRLRAYDLLKDEVEKAAKSAEQIGLDAVVTAFAAPESAVNVTPLANLPVRRKLSVAREDVRAGGSGATEEIVKSLNTAAFRDAVFVKASALDARVAVDAQAASARTVWAMLPESLSAVVARIEKLGPITVERVRMADAGIVNAARNDELGAFDVWLAKSPYSFESLKTRLSFKPVLDREEKSPEKAPEKAPARKS